jgi:hypothetical protein
MPGGHRNTVVPTIGLHTGGLARDLVFIKSTRRSEAAIAWLLPRLDHARRAGFTVPLRLRARNVAFGAGGSTCDPLIPGRTAAPSDIPASTIHRLHPLARDLPQRPGFRAAASPPVSSAHHPTSQPTAGPRPATHP